MTPNGPNPSITPTIASSPAHPNAARTSKPSNAASTASGGRLVAARVTITAILAYQALSVAAIMANPQWNPMTRQLSEYALGHQGWLQPAAFLASALSYAALHVMFGGTALVLLPVAALLVTRSLARTNPSRSSARRTLYRIAYLPLAGFALIWLPEVAGLLPARGWPDRILFLTYTAWVIAVAAPLGRRADQSA